MVDACHGTCVQTHKTHTPRSEPRCKPWASGGDDVFVTHVLCWWGFRLGGGVGLGIHRVYEKSVHPSQHCYQSKTALGSVCFLLESHRNLLLTPVSRAFWATGESRVNLPNIYWGAVGPGCFSYLPLEILGLPHLGTRTFCPREGSLCLPPTWGCVSCWTPELLCA